MPTASAVVADMIDTAVGRTAITFRTLELWSRREARVRPCGPEHQWRRFYLRINVVDRPGVLGEIAGILGKHLISIGSVIQHESVGGTPYVPLVIMTDIAGEKNLQAAMSEIDRLTSVHSPGIVLRVLD